MTKSSWNRFPFSSALLIISGWVFNQGIWQKISKNPISEPAVSHVDARLCWIVAQAQTTPPTIPPMGTCNWEIQKQNHTNTQHWNTTNTLQWKAKICYDWIVAHLQNTLPAMKRESKINICLSLKTLLLLHRWSYSYIYIHM